MIHNNYTKLTEKEKSIVDEMFDQGIREFNRAGIHMDNCDGVERAVEAVATWIVESRKN